jgi:hypothetical protein
MLPMCFYLLTNHQHAPTYGTFTLDVKLVLNENLGGILGGTQCYKSYSLILSEC